MDNNGSGSILGPIIFVLILFGAYNHWSNDKEAQSYESDTYYGTSYDSPQDCPEPENPYNYDTGHYAGWEWGEENGYCEYGNSESFYEGCTDWETQNSDFELCLSQN